jgi:hypothetical protein
MAIQGLRVEHARCSSAGDARVLMVFEAGGSYERPVVVASGPAITCTVKRCKTNL